MTAAYGATSLAVLHAGVSVITVFIAVWVMQATTQGAGLGILAAYAASDKG